MEYPATGNAKFITDLDDRSLLLIFSHLTPRNVLQLESVCTRFQYIAEMFYKTCKTLNMDEFLSEKKILAELSEKTGSYIDNLRATRRTGVFLKAKVVKPLLIHFTNLEHLYLEQIYGLEELFEHMALIFTKLKTASLIDCCLSDKVGIWICAAVKLESLSLARNNIKGSFLTSMTHLHNFKEIDLSACEDLARNHFLQFCKKHPHLRSLGLLDWKKLNQACVNTIFSCLKELETLKIGYVSFDETRIKIKFDALSDLPRLTHLEFLSCGFKDISDFLLLLANNDQLEFLRISLTANNLAFQALTKFTKLKVFDIYCDLPIRPCLDSLLHSLRCKEVLEKAVLIWSNVTNFGVYSFIRMCPNLRVINLRLCEDITDRLFMMLKPDLPARPYPLKIYVKHTQVSYNVDDDLDLDYRNPKVEIVYDTESENEYVQEDDEYMDEESEEDQ